MAQTAEGVFYHIKEMKSNEHFLRSSSQFPSHATHSPRARAEGSGETEGSKGQVKGKGNERGQGRHAIGLGC